MAAAQLIFVAAEGSGAAVGFFEKDGRGCWHAVEGLGSVSGHVGRNGVGLDKREGDGRTPAGLFRIGHAFGCRPKPATALPYRRVTPRSCWVDDPASPYYNTWVEGGGRSGGERLSDYPDSYAYAAVIEYNMSPAVPGRGSAIFLHCGEKPTAGCVAVPEGAMLAVLKWLDPAKEPVIMLASRRA